MPASKNTPHRKPAAGKAAVRKTVKSSRPAKPVKRSRRKGFVARLRKKIPGWPMWIGALLVLLVCWLLFRWIMSANERPDVQPAVDYAVRGIDVSHYQGIIDWEQLRNSATIAGHPLSFVFVKATEGGDVVDPRFAQNFQEARKYGILRGAYHFYRTSSPAKQQAELFISHVQLEEGDLPPVLDVEVKPEGISSEDFRQGILEWLARVEEHYGVKPVLYTYHSFRLQYMNDPVFNLYPYWIAHYYVDSVRYSGKWAFWQYSDRGELPGIKGQVDLDIFNGSYEDLQRMAIAF